MASTPFTSELAAELAEDTLERFLRYVRIDTQSQPGSGTYPSTSKQLDLSRLLVRELKDLGVDDVVLDEHGYVLATLPATVSDAPTVGLLAHVDTSPSVSGAGVRPQVVRAYDGGPLPLPGDPSQVLSPERSPLLAERVGHDLVTTDGTTLLGADDKAGVAEIMAATAHLLAHPELPRARVRLAFTPDEEIGVGTKHLDLGVFGAEAAYTLDGSRLGTIEVETFAALELTVTIRGHSVHPGYAKGKLVNPIKLAAQLVCRLPEGRLSPETTEGREGYVHPHSIVERGSEEVEVSFLVRDFDRAGLAEHENLLRGLADEIAQGEPRARVSVRVESPYRNMKESLDAHPRVLTAAEEAVRRAGLEPQYGSIRGGTDGAVLSAQGLPTPNIFTGGNEFHSVLEWISVQDMAAAAATVVKLVGVWAEAAAGGEADPA